MEKITKQKLRFENYEEQMPSTKEQNLVNKNSKKYIDLFSGLGGFHLALSDLGHTCVFACDIDKDLRECYEKNFKIKPEKDIREIPVEAIPQHDILCAGFPCQPFSKAGFQKGLKDKERGALFYEIIRIIKSHHPEYLIIENVPNIRNHNDGHTWEKIAKKLKNEGYDLSVADLSPHHFGIPQIRLRTYIVGKKGRLNGFIWPQPNGHANETTILSVLDKNPENAKHLPKKVTECLNIWQEFLNNIPSNEKIPLPLWAMEFGATYPYEKTTPHCMTLKQLRKFKGAFGTPITGNSRNELYKILPSHATRPDKKFPNWKIKYIKKNRSFYIKNKKFLDSWMSKIKTYPSSYQKLELNIGNEPRELNRYIIQCRPSGVRVKRPTTAPSLVAMNDAQIPIVNWENRYVTPQECVRLQSMEKLTYLPTRKSKIYKALGNAVNVEVIKMIASSLINED